MGAINIDEYKERALREMHDPLCTLTTHFSTANNSVRKEVLKKAVESDLTFREKLRVALEKKIFSIQNSETGYKEIPPESRNLSIKKLTELKKFLFQGIVSIPTL